MPGDTLHDQLADWVRPVTSLPIPDIRVLRRRARRRVMRRAAAATAATAVVAAAVAGITVSLPAGRSAGRAAGRLAGESAGNRASRGVPGWSAAPGSWTHGVWQPAGALPAADAGPAVAPYIVIPRIPGILQVRRVFSSVRVIATVQPLPGQTIEGVAAAGDDRTFVVEAAVGGRQQGPGYPLNPTAIAFDELRLRPDGQVGWLHLLGTVPAKDVSGGFAVSQDASMLAYGTNNSGFETVSLATGTGRSWPPVDAGTVDSVGLSWAGDRTLAFEWDTGDNPHPPGIGIRVLDVTAPGTLLQASRLIVGYSRYCAAVGVCRDDPLITPDGSAVMVSTSVCLRTCSGYAEEQSGVITVSVVEYSTRTGRAIANVAPPVTSLYPGTLCVPVWTDPSGVQVVTSCGHPQWYDRGHVSRITAYMPMNGTDLLAFAWQPGSPGT
jgi:hypothetical protein